LYEREKKMNKKLLSVILILLMAFSFTACGEPEESEEAAPAAATVAEESTTEADKHPDAISWKKAKNHIGETVTIKGPVKGVFQSTQSSGSPTFINIGKDYPESGRVTVVIWEENISEFDPYSYSGETVYVTGEVYMYDGNPQIEASSPEQIEVK
jgi:DNA/RNA endonuclease YhcR with UshA esterase domain